MLGGHGTYVPNMLGRLRVKRLNSRPYFLGLLLGILWCVKLLDGKCLITFGISFYMKTKVCLHGGHGTYVPNMLGRLRVKRLNSRPYFLGLLLGILWCVKLLDGKCLITFGISFYMKTKVCLHGVRERKTACHSTRASF